jgi:hypothetical protein
MRSRRELRASLLETMWVGCCRPQGPEAVHDCDDQKGSIAAGFAGFRAGATMHGKFSA